MPLWRLHYHLVWATKGRVQLIDDHVELTLRKSLQATGNRLELMVHAVGVMPDHVHVAASIPPKHSVADVIRAIKGASTRLINQSALIGSPDVRWQSEYGVLSFSDRGLGEVISYVEHQRERHAANDLYPLLEQCGNPGNDRTGAPGPLAPGAPDDSSSLGTVSFVCNCC